eukprot:maker-scaffold270_size230592-snap-gene-0.9 protein:Tk10966 transcript:maker-scaffold270_size230592-snap-gene-0.9-mRNA-1 annotation:"hypothetical protein L798_10755"
MDSVQVVLPRLCCWILATFCLKTAKRLECSERLMYFLPNLAEKMSNSRLRKSSSWRPAAEAAATNMARARNSFMLISRSNIMAGEQVTFPLQADPADISYWFFGRRQKIVVLVATTLKRLVLPIMIGGKLGFLGLFLTGLGSAQDYTDECPVDNGFFADAVQCDRYYECKDSQITDHLCPDGLVFDESSTSFAKCSFPFSVECNGRNELQPAKPSRTCPRLNGYFGHEDPKVCDKFYFCVDGVANPVSCPNTLVFDPTKGQCGFVDQVNRPGCSSEEVYAFSCPATSNSPHAHPRYPDPDDCQFFYLCIGGTNARRNGCSEGLVFNPDTSSCDRQSNVVGPCSTWYNETELVRINNPSATVSKPKNTSGNPPRTHAGFRRKAVARTQATRPQPPANSPAAANNFANFAPVDTGTTLTRSPPRTVRTKIRPATLKAGAQQSAQKNRARTRVRRPPPTQAPLVPEEEDKPLTFALSSDEAIQRFREQNQFVPSQPANNGGGRLTVLSQIDPRPSRLSPQESSAFRDSFESDSENKFASFPSLPRSRQPPQFENFESQRAEEPRTVEESRRPEPANTPEQARQQQFRSRNQAQSRRPVVDSVHTDPFQTDFGPPEEPRDASPRQQSASRSRLQVTPINVKPRAELTQGDDNLANFELQRIPNARGPLGKG